MVIKRICYFGDSSSIHMVRWANVLLRNGWHVHVVSDRQPCEGYDEGVMHHRIHTPTSHNVRLPFVTRLWMTLNLIRTVRRIDPAVMHAHSIPGYGDYMGILSKILPDVPIVVTAWGFSHMESELSRPMRYFLSRMALRSAVAVTTSAPRMADKLSEAYGLDKTKIATFSWGVDLETFRHLSRQESEPLRIREEIPADADVILSPRTMHPHYRIEMIVKAASCVLRKNPNTIFILLAGYGSDTYSQEIHNLVNSSGIEKNVRIVKRLLSPKEMAEYFSVADFIIQIPKTDQLSATLLEAMACGAIPILSDLEVYRNRLRPGTNVLYTETENPSSLAATITKAIGMPQEERDVITARNREMIESDENFQENAQNMIRIYEDLTRGD